MHRVSGAGERSMLRTCAAAAALSVKDGLTGGCEPLRGYASPRLKTPAANAANITANRFTAAEEFSTCLFVIFQKACKLCLVFQAGVAELADALRSGRSDRKVVWVQIPSPVPFSKRLQPKG